MLTDAEAKGEKTIVLGHMPVAPLNEHNVWNDSAVIAAMEKHHSGKVPKAGALGAAFYDGPYWAPAGGTL